MRSKRGSFGALTFRTAALGAVASLLPPGPVAAQQAPSQRVEPIVYTVDADGAGPDFDARTLRRGFDLFASGDGAISGFRATGRWGSSVNNYGPCDGTFVNCQNNRNFVPVRNGNVAPFFELEYYAAAPPSQFLKIRQVAPSIANTTGGGWTADFTRRVVGTNTYFGPRDNTLGRMFSGVTTTTDGSCRDHQFQANAFHGAGLQILPTSDCPETWGSEGWRGAHPIDLAGYATLFAQQGSNFTFDFWRVPEAQQRLDKPFMGTRHHTYGESSDHGSNFLLQYGAVVPGGSGNPTVQGYPLGLVLHFDAFNFGVPTVNDAAFYQMTIINRSADVWGGEGIDYDSLYFGIAYGGGYFPTQAHSAYALVDKGLMVYHNSNAQGAGGPCSDAARLAGGGGCAGAGTVERGYGAGANAIIMFKTPLGDLRNKLFTRTSSGAPCIEGVDNFCMPSHPLAGDTITFNGHSFGDYGGAYQWTWGAGMRASFGFISGDEVNTLAGRDPGAATDRQLWTTFRSEDWTTNKVHYNKYVPPGNWDYNKDGVLDTLNLAVCGRLGCAGLDSDTMPGGWLNRRGNIGGFQGFGPFSLGAGDTTSLVYAIVGDGDSTAFWAQVNAVIDLYLNFFLAPEAPPPARIVSTQVAASTDQFGTANPSVRLFFSDDPESWEDPFLMKTASDVETSPGYAELLTRNPWLPDSIRARARNNLQRIEIYKSCNGGNSWTSDGDCDGDPAVELDGTQSGFGWRTYGVLDVDANSGNIPNSFFDGNVDGGRTYMYAFVGRSRGAEFKVDTIGGGPAIYTFAPSIPNALSRSTSDPNVASVYIPASKPAGYQAAAVAFSNPPLATVPFTLSLSDNVATASYRAVFGNQIVVARDSNTATNALVQSVVTIRRRATVDDNGVGVDSVIRSESFVYASDQLFLVEGTGVEGAPTVVDDITTIPTTYTGLGFVLATTGGQPVFGSVTLTANAATPAGLFGRDEYTGFTINADNSVAGTFEAAGETQYRGPESRAENNLLETDTIVQRDIVNNFMPQWREASSTRAADGGGRYVMRWVDDSYGTARGFTLNLNNPSAVEAEVRAALAARAQASTGVADAATAALLGQPLADLVPVKLPFTIENVTYGRPVEVAMVRRVSNRIVLGQGQDTVSVEIPEDVWVPGDRLVFIENIVEDSVIGGRVVLSGGTPVQRTRRAVTFTTAVVGCNQIRESCNPVVFNTVGGSGYNPMRNGDETRFHYYVGFQPTTEYAFDVSAAVTGEQITAVTDSALGLIRVVPNPFVIYSAYQTSVTNSVIAFTNLPSRGALRIYTVAGQFVQQILWEPADLEGEGDLFWNLRSREGIDIASGLYIWVVTAPSNPNDPASAPLQKSGKFVVIRGDAQ